MSSDLTLAHYLAQNPAIEPGGTLQTSIVEYLVEEEEKDKEQQQQQAAGLRPEPAHQQHKPVADGKVDDKQEDQVDEDEPMQLKKEDLPPLTGRQKVAMIILAFAGVSSTVTFSCIAPFFATEALKKDVSLVQSGVVFSVYELVMFISSPFLGRYIAKFGAKRLFIVGLYLTGFATIVFGLLMWLPNGWPFFTMCVFIRVIEAVGAAGYITASFSITVHEFKGRVCQTIGVLEMFYGLGFAAGPPIGGALYELGGYYTPFVVLGGLTIIVTTISQFVLPSYENKKESKEPKHNRKTRGIRGLVRLPSVLLMCSAICALATSWAFLDPTLGPYLKATHNLTPFTVGLVFIIAAAAYSGTAPFMGKFLDRHLVLGPYVMVLGSALACSGLIMIGPAPFTGLDPLLWLSCIGLLCMGLGSSCLYIPTFNCVLSIALSKGYRNNFTTYGCVSGLVVSAWNVGGFIGPTLFSGLTEVIGFAWTAATVAGVNFIVGTLLAVYNTVKHKSRKKSMAKLASHCTEEPGDQQDSSDQKVFMLSDTVQSQTSAAVLLTSIDIDTNDRTNVDGTTANGGISGQKELHINSDDETSLVQRL